MDDVNIIRETKFLSVTLGEMVTWVLQTDRNHSFQEIDELLEERLAGSEAMKELIPAD